MGGSAISGVLMIVEPEFRPLSEASCDFTELSGDGGSPDLRRSAFGEIECDFNSSDWYLAIVRLISEISCEESLEFSLY